MNYRIPGWGAISLLVLLVVACDGPTSGDSGRPGIDVGAARASLIQADLDFARLAAEDGLADAYLQYLAEDAVQLPDGDLPISGKEFIYENVILATEDNDFSLSWEPVAAEVSASGDLGYTWGTYLFEAAGEDGRPVSYDGKYVSIWRKSSDGQWQIVLDMSNQNMVEYFDDFQSELEEAGYSELLEATEQSAD